MVRSKNLNELIGYFLNKYPLANNTNMIKQKAGIWQGTDSYKDMNMLILRDVNYTLGVLDSNEAMAQLIKPDLEWCEIHFQERIGGIPLNPGESYKVWPYANFKEGDDFIKAMKFDHTYMERFWPRGANSNPHKPCIKGIRFEYGDYDNVCRQLIENPLTRQAYLPIFFPEDTGAVGSIRVPCTLGYLFEIFEDKLDITYYIRSCDVYRHLRNDVYLASKLLIHTKEILFNRGMENIQTGKLIMKIANLHVFENDIYTLRKKEQAL